MWARTCKLKYSNIEVKWCQKSCASPMCGIFNVSHIIHSAADMSLIQTLFTLFSDCLEVCPTLTCIYVCSVPWNFMVSQNVKLFPVEVQCLPNFGKLDLSCMETCPYYLLFHVKYWDSWDSGFRIFWWFSSFNFFTKPIGWLDKKQSNKII